MTEGATSTETEVMVRTGAAVLGRTGTMLAVRAITAENMLSVAVGGDVLARKGQCKRGSGRFLHDSVRLHRVIILVSFLNLINSDSVLQCIN